MPTESACTFADGIACREPHPDALDFIAKGAARIVCVSEDEIADAIRIYLTDTHNMVEPAAAAPLAALLQEGSKIAGPRVGLVVSGANIDSAVLHEVLAGRTPVVH